MSEISTISQVNFIHSLMQILKTVNTEEVAEFRRTASTQNRQATSIRYAFIPISFKLLKGNYLYLHLNRYFNGSCNTSYVLIVESKYTDEKRKYILDVMCSDKLKGDGNLLKFKNLNNQEQNICVQKQQMNTLNYVEIVMFCNGFIICNAIIEEK